VRKTSARCTSLGYQYDVIVALPWRRNHSSIYVAPSFVELYTVGYQSVWIRTRLQLWLMMPDVCHRPPSKLWAILSFPDSICGYTDAKPFSVILQSPYDNKTKKIEKEDTVISKCSVFSLLIYRKIRCCWKIYSERVATEHGIKSVFSLVTRLADTPLQLSNDGTDRQTDGRTPDRYVAVLRILRGQCQ